MTKIIDKKGKKRSFNETSVKSNQKQENIDEVKKGFKKAKFVGVKQNGNPISGERVPRVSKVGDKQKKEQNKVLKQQSSIVKMMETKKDTKEKVESTVKSIETGNKTKSRRGRRLPFKDVNLTAEEITKKIAEIRGREVLSKRAKKILSILNRKLRECENKSGKLDTVGKKSNKKVEQLVNTLMKKSNKDKTKTENKHVQKKDQLQEEEDDDDSEIEEEEDDSEIESEGEESDESDAENELVGSLSNKKEEVDNESDEDEENEDEEEIENEEDDEEVESEDDEEVDDEESEEDEEDEDDEENEEDEEDEEDDEKDMIKKGIFSEISRKEVQNKNKQEQNKNKQELNKNKQEQNKNKQQQNKNKQEQNKNKQVPQFVDNQQKGESKKRYVLFVGNLPLDITENEIRQHFSTKVDTITSIRIPTKPDRTSRGFAYVEMTNNIDFEKGLSLNHTFLKKRRINVEYSMPSGGRKTDATKKHIVAKNMKLQALQKAGKLADGNRNRKPFKKEK